MNPAGFITMLLAETGAAPERLLQHLCATQQAFSCVPDSAVDELAAQLGKTPAHIQGVIDFYRFLHRHPRGDFDILFSDNITDQMLDSRRLFDRFCRTLGVEPGVPRADGRVSVDLTSCTGLCDQGPALLVNGFAITGLNEAGLEQMVKNIEAGIELADWPADWFVVKDNIRRSSLLLANDITAGAAISLLLQQGGDSVLERIKQSGLRGRGGAGFNTALKWQLCRDAPADAHYVVCNADEGEPGTFKDRVLLNRYADTLFEGMTVCAGVVGARKGYLYLRGEYRYLLEALEAVLQRRREQNLLGDAIAGQTGFDFDIDIHLGAGAYICGEESALIESLEGRRGIPRKRPPFPVTNGLFDRPTVVNNVETFVAAAKITVSGANWFRAVGTGQSPGTKLLSISGDCARPGIYEYPFGVSVKQVLDDCGAQQTQAVQVAGAAGITLSPAAFERRIAFEDVATGGSFMVFNRQRDLLAMVQNFTDFFCHESCGFCTPCRVGGQLMKQLVDKVAGGHATVSDLAEMRHIGQVMQQASHCGLGVSAVNALFSTLDAFPEVYRRRLAHRGFEPAFDLEAALAQSRQITGRDDPAAHIADEAGGEP